MRHIVSINAAVVKDVGYDWRGFGIVMGVRAERGRHFTLSLRERGAIDWSS